MGLLFGALSVVCRSVRHTKPPIGQRLASKACLRGPATRPKTTAGRRSGACTARALVAVLALAPAVSLGLACNGNDTRGNGQPTRSSRDNEHDSGVKYDLVTTLTLGSTSLSPGEVTDVDVQIQPPGSHDVQIAITKGGELAFLHDSVLITDSNGRAKTKLTVTRTAVGMITLSALVKGAAPEFLHAEIVPPAEATLNVVPVYAGNRPFTEWQVAVVDDPTCPASHAAYLGHDTHTFDRPTAGEALFLNGVPAGRPVSVLVRAEEYAFGCSAGVIVTNEKNQVVEVNVVDEPLLVDDFGFPMRFGVHTHSEPFWRDLGAYLSDLGDAFRAPYEADSVALLSKMQQLASSPEAFSSNRESKAWDALLELRLSAAGASEGLTSRVQRWLLEGAQLLQSGSALRAQVEATSKNRARVELLDIASLELVDAGIAKQTLEATLNTSGTDDVLRLAFSVEFAPSRLFGALASKVVAGPVSVTPCAPSDDAPRGPDAGVSDAGNGDAANDADSSVGNPGDGGQTPTTGFETTFADAQLADAGTFDPPTALAASVGCSTVGVWLSEGTGVAYEGCDAACAARLCERAIMQLWQQVLDADTETKTLQVSAAGRAALDARAHVVGLTDGQWIGTTDLFSAEPRGTLQGCTASASR